jgi:recombinase
MSAPRSCPDEALALVTSLRRAGKSYRAICTVLNEVGIATPQGRPVWHPSYVHRLVNNLEGRRLMSAFGDA